MKPVVVHILDGDRPGVAVCGEDLYRENPVPGQEARLCEPCHRLALLEDFKER